MRWSVGTARQKTKNNQPNKRKNVVIKVPFRKVVRRFTDKVVRRDDGTPAPQILAKAKPGIGGDRVFLIETWLGSPASQKAANKVQLPIP